jgi:hypothetical protein
MKPHPLLALLASAILVLPACASRDDAAPPAADASPAVEAQPAPAAAETKGRVILFAPVALGKLAPIYPDGAMAFARKAALYTDLLARDATGQSSPRLPDGASAEWSHGMPVAARGAHLVVLTSIIDLHRVDGPPDPRGSTQNAVAVVEMRGLDRTGAVVFSRKATGEAPTAGSPKFSGEINEPESLAAWQAISTCLGALRSFLTTQQDLPPAPPEVEVAIESDPPKADILVDGVFRGTTPMTLRLPTRPLAVRIERQGYQPWQRQLAPVLGMRIQPALEPVPGAHPPEATPAQPAPAGSDPAGKQDAAPTGK